MKRLLPPVMVAILLLGLWQWWVMAYDIPPFLVPSPLLVMKTLANDWPLLSGSLLVTLSQSGETADTLAALRYAKSQGLHTIAIVNVPTSTIARESETALPTLAGIHPKRAAAALLIPLRFGATAALVRAILKQPETESV